jgi:CubicO group peptidase (beta-lactamase class C family)
MMFLVWLLACSPLAHAAFPSAFGGCPHPPPPPSSAGVTPRELAAAPRVAQAFLDAEAMLALLASRGIPLVDSGLFTSPTAALSVGVVLDQELVWSRGYGLRNRTDPASAVDADSIFRIGSISKIFAMLALVDARDRGLLSLDDDVRKFVPEFSVKPGIDAAAAESEDAITLAQLATHMAGLTRETPCTGQPDGGRAGTPISCDMSDAVAFQRIAQTTAIFPPNTLPIYSNLGFEVLGHTVRRASSFDSYEEMIDRVILKPLGMRNSGVNMSKLTAAQYSQHLALPYQEGFKPCGQPCLRDFGWSSPSGAMYSTVNDLAKILQLMFQHDAPSSKILRPSTLRETLLPRYLMPDREGGYALTWELYRIGDYMLRTKRGDVDGYASEIIMIPELKLGFVVLASEVEHAQYAAQRLVGILLDPVAAQLTVSAKDRPRPPYPFTSYEGTFKPSGPLTSDLGALTVANVSGVLSIDYGRSILEFVGVRDTNQHIFRMVPWPGEAWGPTAKSCSRTQMDDWYELVFFEMEGTSSMRFTFDFVYGNSWVKQ